MRKKSPAIPVSVTANEGGTGISIERLSLPDIKAADRKNWNQFQEEASRSHRHDGHSFFLLEKGNITIELDFTTIRMKAPSIIYVNPEQVHRTIRCDNVTVCSWAISPDRLNPENLKWLNQITPAKALPLRTDTFAIFTASVNLLLNFSERKDDRLYHSLIKDSCNALVALVISQYLAHAEPGGNSSRFEIINRSFKKLLEENFTRSLRPAAYARMMNISGTYLNECVRQATGHSVSEAIHQRVVLEAKRLLYYSDQSVKEISRALGFDDYAYFSRLFTKTAGMSALSFRTKNRD